ncbi:vacuolar sorting protein Did2 [Schizosaccharomyces cryophilus OY26]|uniref:Vacuolar sorting protein Did2 n=1 Tax=Schizosaccharomyces cryophilus (strain OY26 / ATCC MYA-4695 / CBS 11777 / NBRC 106824 / NRRL Y48691) TaxID=653667 RepID=S9X901_SCHCR|nr:vacuolar sorting protein Did2 [Schizosaccharomyces cryophilus OY26]EPY53677.1 vacuolar sorting protein Did2 [Schizosaccharomyces cryophilus OY26]
MSNLEASLFQLKFAAKSLNKQSLKASKEERLEREKVKKAIMKGNQEVAQIYASNAIRKQQESLNLLKLASRIDAVSSRLQTAVTMRAVSGNMASVVRGMDKAMQSMNLDMISQIMDKFESQFDDVDVQTDYMHKTMGSATAVDTPQENVDLLMQSVADEAGLEFNQNMNANLSVPTDKVPTPSPAVEDDNLQERLRALRSS